MDLIQAVLLQILFQSPLLIAWIVGLILAGRLLSKHPPLRWVLFALVVLLMTRLIGTVWNVSVPWWSAERALSAMEIGRILAVTGAMQMLLETLGWVLLLVGLFSAISRSQRLEKST